MFAIAACNGFALAALIAATRAGPPARGFLAALIALVSLRLCSYVLGFAGAYDAHPWLTFAPLDASAAFGPLLFLYVAALTRGPPRRWWVHLVPAGIQLGYSLACFALPLPAKWRWYSGVHLDVVEPVAMALILAQGTGYVGAAWRRHARYQRWLDERFAKREAWRLGWLRAMILAFAAALALTLAAALWDAFVSPLDYFGRVPVLLGFALLAYLLGLLGWRHAAERYPPETPADPDGERAPPRTDYRLLAERWRERVAAAGWWREEGLALADLARRLAVSERTLSRGLREGAGENFNGFVNALRVAAVQRAILDGDGSDLLGLALASGFASKASFNRAFRRVTGQTPSAWRTERRRTAQISPIAGPAAI